MQSGTGKLDETLPQAGARPMKGDPVKVRYTNWRGETAERKIQPLYLWFGSTEWHPEPQWLITARDLDKGVERDFALSGFAALSPAAVAVAPGVGELREALTDNLAHLVAATSLLKRSPKTAAASNKMFDQMVADYEACIERGRATLQEGK